MQRGTKKEELIVKNVILMLAISLMMYDTWFYANPLARP